MLQMQILNHSNFTENPKAHGADRLVKDVKTIKQFNIFKQFWRNLETPVIN